MEIKALTTFEGGYMSEHFVFGGTRDKELCSTTKQYPYYIISYLIDTGKEVILVDTSMPDSLCEMPANEELGVYIGKRTQTFEQALNVIGYQTSDVDKIILTHHNFDHVGMISLFPNAEIYISKKDEKNLQDTDALHIIGVDLDKHPLFNFDGSFEVAENIYMVQAYGHTKGHSIVLVYDEKSNGYVLIAGDATVTDEAISQNEMMIVYEDLEKSKDTLNKLRDFMGSHKTVYLSTHDPIALGKVDNLK